MSWLKTPSLLAVFVAVLGLTTTSASAGNVDWSQYIEKNPSRKLVKTSGKAKPTSTASAKKAKKSKAKSRVKARSRAKARSKSRRR